MRTILSVVSFTVLSVVLFSCQREVQEPNPNNPVIESEGAILWKYAEIDTTLPRGLDTTLIILYEYDAQSRVSRIITLHREDTATTPEYRFRDTVAFSYTGNDTLPNLARRYYGDYYGNWAHSERHLVFNAAKLVSDSVYEEFFQAVPFGTLYKSSRAYYYTHGGAVINSTERTRQFSPSTSLRETFIVINRTLGNGNIATENAVMTGGTSGGWDMQISYDNKKNPFYLFKAEIPSYITCPEWLHPANNPVSFTSVSGYMNKTLQYIYQNNNLPAKVVVKEIPGSAYEYTGLFFYR